MEFSKRNLQLNTEQITLSYAQQEQLLRVFRKLLKANFDPRRGSILIVRTWADGEPEEILSGDLAGGETTRCYTKKIKYRKSTGPELVNDTCCGSVDYVCHEVSEAVHCEQPNSFYYGKLDPRYGSLYSSYGHYVLSLPLENGRLVASYRANYCRRESSVNERWQHRLMLTALAETFQAIMPSDRRLRQSLSEVLSTESSLASYQANKDLIRRCLLRNSSNTCYRALNLGNSKLQLNVRRAHA